MVKNLSESVRARLLNIARQSNLDFNAVLLTYAQERFLYRLSKSAYRKRLVLKGALMFVVYEMPGLRPTRDIDFLELQAAADLAGLVANIREICAIPADDGIAFDGETVRAEEIRENQKYNGARVKFTAQLGSAVVRLQIDVGYGDVIVPAAQEITFPILLDDQPAPEILVYSKESAIAEKFEAIVSLNVVNSRMKDFYDIAFMAEHSRFELAVLRNALNATFNRRGTSLNDRNIVFSDDFRNDSDKQQQWTAFLNRHKLDAEPVFSIVVERLYRFLEPVCRERVLNFFGMVRSGDKWSRVGRKLLWVVMGS